MNLSLSSVGRFVALLAAILLSVDATTENSRADEHSGIFGIRLEANKSVYHSGEVIELRVTVHNNTDQTYYVTDVPPWGMSKLLILNEQGQPLKPKRFPLGYEMVPNFVRIVSAGMTFINDYNGIEDYHIIRQWAKIDYWGYDLTAPGKYTISAIPTITAFQQARPYFTTSGLDKSNTIKIEILK
jgi:hypothetical protein